MAEEAKRAAPEPATAVAGEGKEGVAHEEEEYRVDVRGMSATAWLRQRFGMVPSDATGWFRAGVGFYNKGWFHQAIECLSSATRLDVEHYNAYQVMARAHIAVNQREEAVECLKRSVALDNASDWQLLAELTAYDDNAARTAADTALSTPAPAKMPSSSLTRRSLMQSTFRQPLKESP